MRSTLARVLLQKGVIRQGTVAHSPQNVRGLSCLNNTNVLSRFVIAGARLLDGTRVVFDVIDQDHGACRLSSEDIISIDGMQTDRIAASHSLTLDGEQLPARSRRRRRSKSPADVADQA